ncbi:diguanylate cyclase [Acidithiobacillus sp.]|uniref:TackOD1 domain-containing metal-binding protein n=1 Tax=Acidithiobacillus sp. TaxID=1872118 RepID=UPI0025C35E74|nr:diguanylate cyclase [Acidithiobacillus sp.]MCK9189688.1 diguanylate cyclase [Acidithiobacillus sp.]MCK9359498.1 diguanylate cyclase [Acidithiobacillus sp.]
MPEDSERHLNILRRMQLCGGEWLPIWTPCFSKGYVYDASIESMEINDILIRDLQYLVQNDYLEKTFFEILTRCPACNSHHVNVREVCVSCKSAHIEAIPLIHHFRCGYVGPIYLFERDDKGARRCPKCEGKLEHLGTDHDLPGENHHCVNCNASFQSPDVEAFCLSCQKRSRGLELIREEVDKYQISSLGFSALHRGRFFEADNERFYEADSQIIRHHLFMQLLEDERNRQHRYGIPFSLLLVQPMDMADPLTSIKIVADRIASNLRNTDRLGRLDKENLLIVLSSCDSAGAAIAKTRLVDSSMRTLSIETSPKKTIQEQIETARALLKNNDRIS